MLQQQQQLQLRSGKGTWANQRSCISQTNSVKPNACQELQLQSHTWLQEQQLQLDFGKGTWEK